VTPDIGSPFACTTNPPILAFRKGHFAPIAIGRVAIEIPNMPVRLHRAIIENVNSTSPQAGRSTFNVKFRRAYREMRENTGVRQEAAASLVGA